MKYFSPQTKKWVLSSMMIAALGSQYYFSSYSNEYFSLNMSSTAPTTKPTPEELATKMDGIAKYFSELSKQPSVGASSGSTAACEICKDPKFTDATKAIADLAKDLAKLTPTAAAPEKPTETPAERRERLQQAKEERQAAREAAKEEAAAKKEEREDARQAVKEAKEEKKRAQAEKAKEDKKTRTEEFKEKAEELAAECSSDISCFADGFTTLLTRYTGSDKIDPSAPTAVFSKYFNKEIQDALKTPGLQAGVLRSLEELTGDLPAEYKALKIKVMNGVENAYKSRAQVANSHFALADQATKAKRFDEAQALFQQANYERNAVINEVPHINNALSSGLYASDDSSGFDYFRQTYLPDMQRLITDIVPTTGLNTMGSLATTTTGVRTGRGNGAVGNINTGVATNSSNILNSVQFGSPSTNLNNNRVLNSAPNSINANAVRTNNAVRRGAVNTTRAN